MLADPAAPHYGLCLIKKQNTGKPPEPRPEAFLNCCFMSEKHPKMQLSGGSFVFFTLTISAVAYKFVQVNKSANPQRTLIHITSETHLLIEGFLNFLLLRLF